MGLRKSLFLFVFVCRPYALSNIRRADDGHFDVRLPVAVSPAFFAWVFQFGGGIRVLSPPDVVEQLKERAEALLEQYQ